MIILDSVSKHYVTPLGRHHVLDDVSMTVPLGRNIGVIGRNGSGKSTLLRLMAGVDYPNSGRITRIGRYSWPLALAGRGIQGTMTGTENVKFAGRIHGLRRNEIDRLARRVEDFAELGDFFDMPVSTYSSGMRARLSFAIAMLFEFDCYFIDELNAVGDWRFRKMTKDYFDDKRKKATFIQVSHDLDDLHKTCEAGILVDGGRALYFEEVDEAIRAYRSLVGDETPAEPQQKVAHRAADPAPVVVAQTREARRIAARVRKRNIERANPAPPPAPERVVEAPPRAARRPPVPRQPVHQPEAAPPPVRAVPPAEAIVRKRAMSKLRRPVKPGVVTLGISPAQQLALKSKIRASRINRGVARSTTKE